MLTEITENYVENVARLLTTGELGTFPIVEIDAICPGIDAGQATFLVDNVCVVAVYDDYVTIKIYPELYVVPHKRYIKFVNSVYLLKKQSPDDVCIKQCSVTIRSDNDTMWLLFLRWLLEYTKPTKTPFLRAHNEAWDIAVLLGWQKTLEGNSLYVEPVDLPNMKIHIYTMFGMLSFDNGSTEIVPSFRTQVSEVIVRDIVANYPDVANMDIPGNGWIDEFGHIHSPVENNQRHTSLRDAVKSITSIYHCHEKELWDIISATPTSVSKKYTRPNSVNYSLDYTLVRNMGKGVI